MKILKQIDQFVNDSLKLPNNRQWFKEKGGIQIYVRYSPRYFGSEVRHMIDISNIDVPEALQGKGWFTSFLVGVEEIARKYDAGVFVENVLTAKFNNFLKRKGYEEDASSQNSLYKPLISAIHVIGCLRQNSPSDQDFPDGEIDSIVKATDISYERLTRLIAHSKKYLEKKEGIVKDQLYSMKWRDKGVSGYDLVELQPI